MVGTFNLPNSGIVLRGFPVKPIEAWAKRGRAVLIPKGFEFLVFRDTKITWNVQGSRKIRASHKETFCFVVGQIGSLFSDYIITTAGQKRKREGELSSRIFGRLTVCAGAKRDLHEHGAGWPSQFTICRGKQSVSGDWGSSKKSISYEIWEAFLVGDWKIGTSVRSSLTDKTDSPLVVVLQ